MIALHCPPRTLTCDERQAGTPMTESEWRGDDFSTYTAMKQSGSSPDEVYRAAVRDGVDTITMFRLIRSVFSLGLADAKENLS